MKLVESIKGTVRMADGGGRYAYRNTYRGIKNSADGASFTTVEEVRIEFLTDTAAGRPRVWRKTSPKQAATFAVEID